ncbi:MAG: hotdog fold thioesterase [Firmicutes bacterium]|nr:hotdog fold thioesterase [Bacillota bacterium]
MNGDAGFTGPAGAIQPEVGIKIRQDAFTAFLGIEMLEIRPGFARAALAINKNLINFNGVTHGGAVFALADAVFAAASNSHGQVALALNINVSFMKATREGARLTAVAEEENRTARTALYRITVRDGEGDLVAVAGGLVYRKKEPVAKGP